MVASLLFTIVSLLEPAPQAAGDGATVCYAAKVGELLALQKTPAVAASRGQLAALGDDRFGLQHLLAGFLRVKVEQGEGALVVPDWGRSPSAFLDYVEAGIESVESLQVVVRVPKGARARGEMWLPVRVGEEEPSLAGRRLERFPFEFPADAAPVEPARFDEAIKQEAARLARLGVPGKPFFDARASGLPAYDALVARGLANAAVTPAVTPRQDELSSEYELFTGGRALQENLQLDRMRSVATGGDATIAISSIEGITIDAVDWSRRLSGAEPKIEPLAAWVPADQLYVAFPSFGAMTRLLDEMELRGDSLVQTLEPRGEDARTRARLERQICLSTSLAARLLGPAVVKSVAFTASDPYLREGTDVALLFECVATLPIEQHLASARAEAARKIAGCVADDGDHGRAHLLGVVSPDRRVSSYSATIGDVVLVSNSKRMLERLIDAHSGEAPVHAKSDEFRFFRSRYPLAPERDAALIVLSDPFLRRFCGPAWRIAEGRRLRCAAVLSRLEGLRAAGATEEAEALARREHLACPSDPHATHSFGPGGARCSLHGGAGFLTPIAETPVDRATPAERDAYQQFRSRYQQYWRQYFDPIAIEVAPGEPLAIDMTVLPLIEGTGYREFRQFAYGNGELGEHDGDPHADSIWHLIVHVNPESEIVKEYSEFLASALPNSPVRGLPWLGRSVELYFDDSPFLDTLKRSRDPATEAEKNLARVPLALRLSLHDPLSFALVLSAGRAYLENSMPGATVWENRTHGDLPYVVVRGKTEAGVGGDAVSTELAQMKLCYATISGGFCISLDEELLKRALDRGKARAAAAESPLKAPAAGKAAAPAWLGKHVAMTLDVPRLLDLLLLASSWNGGLADRDAALCFANLPALDAWHERDAAADPVERHADLFGVAPVCPSGGSYAFDPAIGAMVCSRHGHPLRPLRVEFMPKALADLRRLSAGITFEDQGVCVRLAAERKR